MITEWLTENRVQRNASSVRKILRLRGQIDDHILVGLMNSVLIEMESFSKAEKNFYVVSEFINQFDNGGFGAYFSNSGIKAHLLAASLSEIGAVSCREVVLSAISVFDDIPSSNYDEMLTELDNLYDGSDEDPWEKQDEQFYDLDEDLESLLIDYVSKYINHFV